MKCGQFAEFVDTNHKRTYYCIERESFDVFFHFFDGFVKNFQLFGFGFAFNRALVEGREAPLCGGFDGLRTLAVTRAVLAAAAGGRAVAPEA